ncbi:MAG: DUF1566 domain-containing protein [Marinifilaceae bacterium]|jgi:hypothetical protein|nr:DUF1566 domain-containing protein [Marinifilaceae bacterium]
MKTYLYLFLFLFVFSCSSKDDDEKEEEKLPDRTYVVVDTKQGLYFNNNELIFSPKQGEAFYGQDANYTGEFPLYTDNGDETITDRNTGLMWQKNMGTKMTLAEAEIKAASLNLGGYSDWRVPSIKELYSLMIFSGQVKGEKAIEFFIDTAYFDHPLGDTSKGEREIDAQTWSSTQYVGKTMNGDITVFGVNFVDGRIKGYPKFDPKTKEENKMYFRLVRGNISYGKNNFKDNNDGTISDIATGLMWQQADDGNSRDWENSLKYAENSNFASYSDWRLPNAKELQSIVDYSKSPQTTNSPAIDDIFKCTEIMYPDASGGHYPFYWTSTSHMDGENPYSSAVYIAFGEGLGQMNNQVLDVHGAGCQRSDPKSGDKNAYPQYFGPQGDIRYVYNYVRLVRDIQNE